MSYRNPPRKINASIAAHSGPCRFISLLSCFSFPGIITAHPVEYKARLPHLVVRLSGISSADSLHSTLSQITALFTHPSCAPESEGSGSWARPQPVHPVVLSRCSHALFSFLLHHDNYPYVDFVFSVSTVGFIRFQRDCKLNAKRYSPGVKSICSLSK